MLSINKNDILYKFMKYTFGDFFKFIFSIDIIECEKTISITLKRIDKSIISVIHTERKFNPISERSKKIQFGKCQRDIIKQIINLYINNFFNDDVHIISDIKSNLFSYSNSKSLPGKTINNQIYAIRQIIDQPAKMFTRKTFTKRNGIDIIKIIENVVFENINKFNLSDQQILTKYIKITKDSINLRIVKIA